MSYIVFGDSFSFPEGYAATNRVFTYAKGFIENGINTHVICFNNEYQFDKNGFIAGINYYHPFRPVKRDNSFIVRNWYKFTKYLNTIRLINRINKTDKIAATIVYSKDSVTLLFAFLFTWIFGSKLIIENSEHPLKYYQSGILKKIIGYCKLQLEILSSDGILLISQKLINLYASKYSDNTKLLLVPSTVDPGRFKGTLKRNTSFEYIGYFGSINFDRDNVDLLVRSFASIADKYNDIHLLLGGPCIANDKELLDNLIQNLKIESKVHILNYLSREEVTQYIKNSKILVLVRNSDLFTDASYPSKLTEYLATGNPVISVKVGEIPKYLQDNVNAFLVDPGDIESLAEKLKLILGNYDHAKEIAAVGQQLTYNIFNYNFQSKRIIDFIDSL
jgi:glycosyltransferase involved in cell wall biosynthesis